MEATDAVSKETIVLSDEDPKRLQTNKNPGKNPNHVRLKQFIHQIRTNDPSLETLNVSGSLGNMLGLAGQEHSDDQDATMTLFQELIHVLQEKSCRTNGSHHTNSHNHIYNTTNTTTSACSITRVNIIVRFLRPFSNEDILCFFQAIGSLPTLKELRVGSFQFTGLILHSITHALVTNANRKSIHPHFEGIQVLRLHNIHHPRMTTSNGVVINALINDDYMQFGRALQNLQELTEFSWDDGDDIAVHYFDHLIQTLTARPAVTNDPVESTINRKSATGENTRQQNTSKLATVFLKSYARGPPNQPLLSQTSIRSLLHQSDTLQSLTLKRLNLAPHLPELLLELVPQQQSQQQHATCSNNDNTTSRCPTLQSLCLEQNQLDTLCGMTIASLLLLLDASATQFRNIPNATASKMPALTELYLGYNVMTDTCGVAIGKVLTTNKTLKRLDLSANLFGPSTGTAVASALRYQSTLEYLNLSHNRLGDVGGGLAFATTLRTNTALKELSLSEIDLHDDGCIELAKMLATNKSLVRLNLAYNKITNDGCIALARIALTQNETLQKLSLNDNKIGNDGVEALVKVLCPDQGDGDQIEDGKDDEVQNQATVQQDSDIDNPDPNHSHLNALLRAATNAQQQREGRIRQRIPVRPHHANRQAFSNSTVSTISQEGFKQQQQMMKTNTTLQYLNLSRNERMVGTRQLLQSLAKMTESNMNLQEVWMDNILNENDEFGSAIQFYLQLNKLGRKDLLQQDVANNERWIQALDTCSSMSSSTEDDSLRYFYYLIRANPTICDFD